MDGIRDNIGRFRDNVQFFIITIAAHVCVSWYEVLKPYGWDSACLIGFRMGLCTG